VLSQDVARQYGLSLGDIISIFGGQHARVVGVLETSDTLNRRALSNLLFADIATAQELLRQGSLSHIDLIVQPEDKAAIAAIPTGVKLETAEAQKNGGADDRCL